MRAVEFLLLFEEREVFADRDLRNLEQLGQLHDGYGAVLLQEAAGTLFANEVIVISHVIDDMLIRKYGLA